MAGLEAEQFMTLCRGDGKMSSLYNGTEEQEELFLAG
jgi:hypothetical protein